MPQQRCKWLLFRALAPASGKWHFLPLGAFQWLHTGIQKPSDDRETVNDASQPSLLPNIDISFSPEPDCFSLQQKTRFDFTDFGKEGSGDWWSGLLYSPQFLPHDFVDMVCALSRLGGYVVSPGQSGCDDISDVPLSNLVWS